MPPTPTSAVAAGIPVPTPEQPIDAKQILKELAKQYFNVPGFCGAALDRLALPLLMAYAAKTKTPFDDMAFGYARAVALEPAKLEIQRQWDKLMA